MNITVLPFEECVFVVAYVNVSHSSLNEQCIVTYEKQMYCKNLTYYSSHKIFRLE